MKKIFYSFIIIAFVMGINSCSKDFLDQTSPSVYTADVVFNSTTFAQYALNGCYARLTQGNMYGARLSLNYTTNSDIEFVGADETSYNQTGNRGQSNYFAKASDSQMDWGQEYTMIERTNWVIQGIRTSPLLSSGDAVTKKTMLGYLGEALALRAIAYFELARNWGDAPYKTEPTLNDLSNVYLPVTDRDTIYDHCIKDLQEAENYVDWVGGSSSLTTERINKGFIKGLIARMCLSRGGYSIRNKAGFPTERGSNWEYYYTLANKECKEIFENGTHKLNSSFLQLFKNLNHMDLDNSYENMFEVAMGLGRSGEQGYSVGVRFYTNPKYGYGNNANVVNTSAYYFYMFDSVDLRRDVTIAYYNFNSKGKVQEDFQTNPMSYNFQKWDQRWMSDAFKSQNLAANGKIGYGINWVLMRYSDVLLMLAETENALNHGPTALAKQVFKQVRARAFSSAYYKQKVDDYVESFTDEPSFFNAIVKERALEFGGEGIRKYDLVRWNLLSSKIQEQRDALTKMFNRQAPYDNLPVAVYYKYKSDNETIDKSDINFYADRDTTGSAKKGITYLKTTWLSGLDAKTLSSCLNRVTLFSSGLDNPVANRHLYPIFTTNISESRGLLSNSYDY
ncbi:MAG: RagB/SusD family nutrient uptake outer membrane protein [Bacteroidota bacterium]|nr:RagB/SusD family nutrient uptake outer membrane protein [Bacteroidota bacterium]